MPFSIGNMTFVFGGSVLPTSGIYNLRPATVCDGFGPIAGTLDDSPTYDAEVQKEFLMRDFPGSNPFDFKDLNDLKAWARRFGMEELWWATDEAKARSLGATEKGAGNTLKVSGY